MFSGPASSAGALAPPRRSGEILWLGGSGSGVVAPFHGAGAHMDAMCLAYHIHI